MVFKYYDSKIVEIAKPLIDQVCSHIKRINTNDDQLLNSKSGELNMGTTLFELYLVFKKLVALGNIVHLIKCYYYLLLLVGKSVLPKHNSNIENFHIWFFPGVTHWLDISVVKALNRIQKAIDIDQLISVDETVRYSSSAVDTLSIFYQIKIFWEQLDWPDVEGSYTFVAKIIDVSLYVRCIDIKSSICVCKNIQTGYL